MPTGVPSPGLWPPAGDSLWSTDGIVMLARAASLPGGVSEAARRIAAGGTGDDPLRDIAACLVAYGSARVACRLPTHHGNAG